ncbi:hypothetical protein NLG97_g3621 [Lecanicillium saksenae]|uniref:Uncharacterized protein n=1 Tax=Lecanicillium saksenae TaxID=468837 RepID=A0ACC1R081_9HYPO|nr:hypothetical protein NLG97_g3621 [Lecanicillium saksenae]
MANRTFEDRHREISNERELLAEQLAKQIKTARKARDEGNALGNPSLIFGALENTAETEDLGQEVLKVSKLSIHDWCRKVRGFLDELATITNSSRRFLFVSDEQHNLTKDLMQELNESKVENTRLKRRVESVETKYREREDSLVRLRDQIERLHSSSRDMQSERTKLLSELAYAKQDLFREQERKKKAQKEMKLSRERRFWLHRQLAEARRALRQQGNNANVNDGSDVPEVEEELSSHVATANHPEVSASDSE